MTLAEFLDNYQVTAEAPYFEVFVCPDESPNGEYGFFCSHCGHDVNDEHCPTHAPMAFPGLRMAECAATPKHVMFGHVREDYGLPCPWCQVQELNEQLRLTRQCKHRPWRRWKVAHRAVYLLASVGLTGYGYAWGDGCSSCLILTNARFGRGA